MEVDQLELSLFEPSSLAELVDVEVCAEKLADWAMQEMKEQGLKQAAQQRLLMRLQIRHLVESYLVRIPSCQRWQFVAELVDAIEELEPYQEGFSD